MKANNIKIISRVLVVICIVCFCSAPYLNGACNYNNNPNNVIEIQVCTGSQLKTVGNSADYSCYVNPRALREYLNSSNYKWEYSEDFFLFISKRPGGDEIKLKARKAGNNIRVTCRIERENFSGSCDGYTEVNIVN